MSSRVHRFVPAGITLCALVALTPSVSFAAEPNTLTAEEKAEGFRLLFDGKTLTHWDGRPDFWSVEDGAIVGTTTNERPTKGNTFCFYRRELLGDFELRIQWKIEGGNSGIQFRSRDFGNWVCGGYQADIDSGGRYTGILYEERGRAILAEVNEKVQRTADGKKKVVGHFSGVEAIKAAVKQGDWNETRVVAKGNHILQQINGVTTMELIDDEVAKRADGGVLALQLHAGPPMKIRFRSIRAKNLDPEGYSPLFDGVSLTGWKKHETQSDGKWTVEDRAIVGRQHPPGKGGFLRTTRTYKNYELAFETKIEWPFDSGAFLRVGPDGKSHQVTLDYRKGGEIGGIYCPWTQGFVHHCPDGIKSFKKDEWNKVKIRIEGEPSRIQVWVNGTQITDFQHSEKTTKGIPSEGFVCLQVHPGGEGYDKAFAAFRDLRIREID